MTKRYFSQKNVEAVLDDLLRALANNLFWGGAPARPDTHPELDAVEDRPATVGSGQPLVSQAFRTPPVHMPIAGGGPNARHSYKSDLVLLRNPDERTVRILWWHDRDPRQEPHNHPWDFRSAVLYGGYTEERFHLENGVLRREEITYEAGQINVMPANVYHNVIRVEPGTVTCLDCGPARPGNAWGYLDLETLRYVPMRELTPEGFREDFAALNPHTVRRGPSV
jgi:hypothetical protein